MIDAPQIVQSPAMLTAFIPLTVPRAEIRTVMGPGISEVFGALAAQKIAPAGAWLTHHLRMDPSVFDFEICVPTSSPVAAAGRVRPGQIDAATVARTVYRGPYEGLGDAWGEFKSWIGANGHATRADLWECYQVGPETTSDPARWRTELNWPLVAA